MRLTDSGPVSGSTSLRSPEPVPVSALSGNDPGQVGIRCGGGEWGEGCGRFISYADCDSGRAHHHFIPLNEFGPEECWWVCARCKTNGETQ